MHAQRRSRFRDVTGVYAAVPLEDGEVEVPLPGAASEEPAEEEIGALPSLDEEQAGGDAPADEEADTE